MVRKQEENKVPEMQPEDLAKKLKAAHIELFKERSGFPLNQAQRNLEGKNTHAEDSTLSKHVGKIHAVYVLDEGLVLGLVESVQAGPSADDGRVYRPVFFDVFGTEVYKPSLDDSFNTLKQAQADFWKQADQIDAVQATIDGMERKRKELEKTLKDFEKLMEDISE